jgi:hypothetical protein
VIDEPSLSLGIAVYNPAIATLDGLLGLALNNDAAEIVGVDPDTGETVVITTNATTAESVPLTALNGMLSMAAFAVQTLITASICTLQGRITSTLSAMGRNTDTAGFRHEVISNADPIRNPDGTPSQTYQAGPGTTTWLYGILDADGNPVEPKMTSRDPVSTATFAETVATLTALAHKEARQLHALLSDQATASGQSREQATADFVASLNPTARSVERTLRWLIEAVYRMAAGLMGRRLPDDFRIAAQCVIDTGIVGVERLREYRDGAAAGLITAQWYQRAVGVNDTEAEQEVIDGTADAAE